MLRHALVILVVFAGAVLGPGCHTLPYAGAGALAGTKETWVNNSQVNVAGRSFIALGGFLGGLFSGGCNGAGKDGEFVRSQEFDFSEVWDPFGTAEKAAAAAAVQPRPESTGTQPEITAALPPDTPAEVTSARPEAETTAKTD